MNIYINHIRGLVRLERFLYHRFNREHNVDSIIDLLLHDQINVYELLDAFVSFESINENQERIHIVTCVGFSACFQY